MIRSILILDAVLVAALAALWWSDRAFVERREETRVVASAFHSIADAATPAVEKVWRIELKLPGSEKVWVAERRNAVGWRLPTYRDALALPDAIAGFLKSMLESHGVVAGSLGADGPRLGFAPGRTLDARLFDATGSLLLHAVAGDVAPGQRADECFVAVAGEDRVLQIDSNPWAMARLDPSSKFPPFTDTRVIPQVLGRAVPAKVAFSGPEAPALGPIVRHDATVEEMQRTMGKGPHFHWSATTSAGERTLGDMAATAYLNGLSTLAFDDLVGSVNGHEEAFSHPALVITITYDNGESDVLTLGGKTQQGRHLLANGTTRQAFVISTAKAAALHPDVKALLEPPPESAPTSR